MHNSFNLIGRIANIRYNKSNDLDILSVQVITTESYRNKDGSYKTINNSFWTTLFGPRAKGIWESGYLKKGHLIHAVGKIRSTQYTSNGVTVHGHDFIIDDITLLSRTLSEMNSGAHHNNNEIPLNVQI